MSSVFDRQYYIVMYRHGAGGRFVGSLLQKLLDANYADVPLDLHGEANSQGILIHTGLWISAPLGQKYASPTAADLRACMLEETTKSVDPRARDLTPVVEISHDYHNIPVYREIFPTAKIIDITCTPVDSIVCKINGFSKYVLTNCTNRVAYDQNIILSRRQMCADHLVTLVPPAKATELLTFLQDTDNADVKTLMLYSMLNYSWHTTEYFEAKASTYISDAIELPYSALRFGITDRFLETLEAAIGPLSVEQTEYATRNLEAWHAAQLVDVQHDPLAAKNTITTKAERVLATYN